jgi:hypothetical protein
MSDFDDDPVVRDQLQRLAGHHPDDDIAYAAMVQGVRVATRRRAVVGASGLCAALLLGLGTAAVINRDTQHLAPTASSSVDDPVATESNATSTTEASTSSSTSTIVEDTTTSATEPASTEVTTPETSVAGSQPSIPTSSNPSTGNDPPSIGSSSGSSHATYRTSGGSITVVIQDGAMTITSYDVEPGFQMRVDEADADRIRVRFVADEHDARIEVRLVNGVPIAEISDDGLSPDNTFDTPDNEQFDDHGGDDHESDDGGSDHSGDDSSSGISGGDGVSGPG